MFSGSPPKVVWEIWLEYKKTAKTSELKFCQIYRYRSNGSPYLLWFNFCHKTFIHSPWMGNIYQEFLFKVHGFKIFIKDFYREKEDCIEHGAPPKYFRLDLPPKGFNFRLNCLSHRCFKNASNWWSLKKKPNYICIQLSNCPNKIQLFTTQILWISCIATLIKLDRKGSTSTWSE